MDILKITSVQPLRVNRYCYVRITTDEGIEGIGEGGAFGALDAVAAQIAHYGTYLVGKNPLEIEHHWQVMFRGKFFRGSVSMAAISAIDIALWDIAGKYYQAPIYRLLGGKARDRIRCYAHVFAKDDEEMVAGCQKRMKQGFAAIGHLSPFLDEPEHLIYQKTHSKNLEESVKRVALMRETVGSDVDLCIELHRRMNPGEAVQLINQLDAYNVLFVEDPIAPGYNEAMAGVCAKSRIPIATGERLHTLYEFQDLLNRKACNYVRVSITTCGGITGAMKIAHLAEANMCPIIPHNPLSPVATAASIQVCATVDNLLINEYPDPDEIMPQSDAPKSALVVHAHVPVNGYLEVSDHPGLDIELVPNAQKRFPAVDLSASSRLNADGSVRDQ